MGSVGEIKGLDCATTDEHLNQLGNLFKGGAIVEINKAQRNIIKGDLKTAISHLNPGILNILSYPPTPTEKSTKIDILQNKLWLNLDFKDPV